MPGRVRDRSGEHAAARARLIEEMGGRCEECGATEDLEFNHLAPRTWNCRSKSRWVRIAIYRREWRQGILNLLCSDCNKRFGPPTSERDAEVLREFLES